MFDFVLTPLSAVVIFSIACIAGFRYRQVWRAEGPRYQYWVYGLIAAAGLLILGFVPMEAPYTVAPSQ